MKRMPITVSDVSRPLPPFEPPSQDRKPGLYVKALIALMAAGAIAGCASTHGDSLTPEGRSHQNISGALPAVSPTPAPAEQNACDDGNPGDAGCRVKRNGDVPVSSSPTSGLTPAQLRKAYGLAPLASGAVANGPLIAIVAAFESKAAEADLGTYRAQFGLPACTSGTGCFTKVMMTGARVPPGQAKKAGIVGQLSTWSDEIALDLAMASASCPTCRLLLVEAGGSDLDSLASAVNLAASYNPAAISNSWGVVESGNVAGIDPGAQAAFNHPGIAITVAAGDSGVVEFPAASPYVTAVGGTTLAADGSARGWSESVWAPSGNGCSTMFPVPPWQTTANGCTGRFVADVSMIADYNPGVTVFVGSEGGWVVLGGTSVGAPFVAGLYAQAGDYGASTTGAPRLYANLSQLTAVSGAAGQTNGSPNGLAGF
jgi:subtilase family serine protease